MAECQAAYVSGKANATATTTAAEIHELGMANLGLHGKATTGKKVAAAFKELGQSGTGVYLPREECGVVAKDIYDVLETVSPVVEAYYGSYFQPYWISLQQNQPGTVEASSSFGWHIDDNPRQLMKIFIYWNDVAESNGAFRAFTYPVSKELLAAGFKSWSEKLRTEHQEMVNTRLAERPADLKVLEGKAGTVLMFDNNLVHKGTPPREGMRQLAQIEIYPSMTKLVPGQVELALTRPMVRDYPADPRVNDLSGIQLL